MRRTAEPPRGFTKSAWTTKSLLCQHFPQILAGFIFVEGSDFFRRASGDDFAAAVASIGTKVDNPIGAFDDVEIVLDHDDRIALVDQALEHRQQSTNVVKMQARRGLVEQVECLPVSVRDSSAASLIRCASPPESVVDAWPSGR